MKIGYVLVSKQQNVKNCLPTDLLYTLHRDEAAVLVERAKAIRAKGEGTVLYGSSVVLDIA